jgi:hypothetical protein
VPAEIDKVRDFLNLLCHQTWKISDDWRQGALAPDIDPKQVDDAARAIERAFRLSVSTSTHFPCHRVVLSLSESDKIANGILLPDEGVALRRGLAVLEARLKTLDRSRALKRKQLTSTDWDRLDGYRKLLSGRDHYYIRREVFNALFAASAQRKLVLNHLTIASRRTSSYGRTEGVAGRMKLSSRAADRLGKTMGTRLPSIEALGQNAPPREGGALRLLRAIVGFVQGDPQSCRVVRAPTPEEEDARRLHRERQRLVRERTGHLNRIKALLVTHGIRALRITDAKWCERLDKMRTGDGRPIPARLKIEIEREWKRLKVVAEQVRDVEAERDRLVKGSEPSGDVSTEKMRRLGEALCSQPAHISPKPAQYLLVLIWFLGGERRHDEVHRRHPGLHSR